MRPWLCIEKGKRKCIHAIVTTIYTDVPAFKGAYYTKKATVIKVFCNKKKHYITHYLSSCNDYQNTNLFNIKNPQYLPIDVFDNKCKICNGNGFSIITIPNSVRNTDIFMCSENIYNKNFNLLAYKHNIKFSRFEREKCVICDGKGIMTTLGRKIE